MNSKDLLGILSRYTILLILPISGLFIFYLVFKPLTIYPVYHLIKLWSPNAVLLGTNTIFYSGQYAEIISACIGASAYYLLLILNLTTPLSISKRVKSISFLVLSFLILNIIRIVIFAKLYELGFNYFDIAHKITWYFGSTLLVVIVWFANVFIFKINSLPIYTDIKNIVGEIKR